MLTVDPLLEHGAAAFVVLGVDVGLVPTAKATEALHHRMVGGDDHGREFTGAVFLELGSPTADAACEALRKQGFWFGGLLPRWMDRDALLLQKSVNGAPWFEGIQAYTNDAQALLRFIHADADRQRALAELGV